MHVSKLTLKNWHNFREVGVELSRRMFIVGNNGLGKSNLLGAFRFLHDIAKERGGGLQYAVAQRGEMERIRSLFAGKNSEVAVGVEVRENGRDNPEKVWSYLLELKQERQSKKPRRTLVAKEVVKKGGEVILERSNKDDNEDSETLEQTALEQAKYSKEFRPLVKFFRQIKYQHIVPQLIRDAHDLQARLLSDDPYGQNLLNEIAQLDERARLEKLKTIEGAMQQVKPGFSGLEFKYDKAGQPHLEYRHQNWRVNGEAAQNEEYLSDGELRLIGLLWALLRDNHLLLLEEPELSFNEGIVGVLPGLLGEALFRYGKKGMSQIFISTHSACLLHDEGIGSGEVLVLERGDKGESMVAVAKDDPFSAEQIKHGLTPTEIVLPKAQSKAFSI